jgi:hypothetical protein
VTDEACCLLACPTSCQAMCRLSRTMLPVYLSVSLCAEGTPSVPFCSLHTGRRPHHFQERWHTHYLGGTLTRRRSSKQMRHHCSRISSSSRKLSIWRVCAGVAVVRSRIRLGRAV